MKVKTNESIKGLYRAFADVLITLYLAWQFLEAWKSSFNRMMAHTYAEKGTLLMVGLYVAIVVIFIFAFNGYKLCINKLSSVILSQILSILLANCVLAVILILMSGATDQVGWMLLSVLKLTGTQMVGLTLVTFFAVSLYEHIFPPYSMLVIFGEHKNNLTQKLSTRGDWYIIDDEISYAEPFADIASAISKHDAILINDVPSECRNKILKECFDQKKRVYFTPKISDIIVRYSEELNMFDTPLFYCKNLGMSVPQRAIKRLMDIVISLIGIVLTSPIMLVTAIAIRQYDGGPVFYKQKRCTIDGKEFEILKFRSMITDAEKDGKARLASANDSRITPVGRVIRAIRVDELPQFFNILKGDMSVVGPRPERPEINAEYCSIVPEFAYRLRVKAGLTGYAQVYGKYNTSSYDKLKLDLIYVEKCSIILDIQLILLTLKVILTKDATEGVAEGQFTANVATDQPEKAMEASEIRETANEPKMLNRDKPEEEIKE